MMLHVANCVSTAQVIYECGSCQLNTCTSCKVGDSKILYLFLLLLCPVVQRSWVLLGGSGGIYRICRQCKNIANVDLPPLHCAA